MASRRNRAGCENFLDWNLDKKERGHPFHGDISLGLQPPPEKMVGVGLEGLTTEPEEMGQEP